MPNTKKTVITRREAEILCLIAEGFTSSEIAAKLNICEATVNTHIYKLQTKLNAKNRCNLINIAFKEAILFTEKIIRNYD
jgi:DNA-binding NarL/FixJ family response regulator